MGPLIAGVDEAGRGCLVGPLVVAGVSTSSSGVRELEELGVKDSKVLSPRQREALYPEILKLSERVFWVEISPLEIDFVVRTGKKYRKLNYLEAVYFAKVIDELDAETATVDASDTAPARFRDNVCDNLRSQCRVLAAHKADRDFPVVSAASIIAKVERDRQIARLRERHGDFGSGYPSDPVTRGFMMDLLRRGGPLPEFARASWKTWPRLQQSLDAFS